MPFVGKAVGLPLARIAARISAGQTLVELGVIKEYVPPYQTVKEAVFSFSRFSEVDIVLGREMRSTGEVMGIDVTFEATLAKALSAAGTPLPLQGRVVITVADRDKQAVLEPARKLSEMGFTLAATEGTAAALRRAGIAVVAVKKLDEGSPNIIDYIRSREAGLIINTPGGRGAGTDGARIRKAAVQYGVSIITTIQGLKAALEGICSLRESPGDVRCLQDYHDMQPIR